MPSPDRPVVTGDVAEILARDLPWERLSGSTVLVTGASGMLPSYVVHTLLALNDRRGAGITVHGLVRDGDKARRLLAGVVDRPDFHLVVQDVTEPLAWSGARRPRRRSARPAPRRRNASSGPSPPPTATI